MEYNNNHGHFISSGVFSEQIFHMVSGFDIRSVKLNFIKGCSLKNFVDFQIINYFHIFLCNMNMKISLNRNMLNFILV